MVLINVNPGYDGRERADGAHLHRQSVDTPERRRQVVEALVDRVRSSPGVTAAGAGSMAPLNPSTSMSAFSFRAKAGADSVVARVLQYHVTPGYAEALGLQTRRGPVHRSGGLELAIAGDGRQRGVRPGLHE